MKLVASQRLTHVRTATIAAAKLEPPPLRDGLIARPRLAKRMRELAAARVTIVRGHAGYGKTSLLAGMCLTLARNSERVGWYTVDAEDRDPTRFIGGLAAAAARGFDVPLIEGAGSPEDLLVEVLNALAATSQPNLLFIDDAHHLNGSASAALMQAMVAKAPATLRLVFGTRHRLELQLARVRARGALLEIGGPQLAFDREETHRFLAEARGVEPSVGEVERILERTHGWPVALGLLASHDDPPDALLRGGRREIADFFDEEVLSGQPAELLAALDIAAAPDRVCARLFDAMTGGSDGGALLDRLFAQGFFVRPMDDEREWFRVHPLLADLSRQRFKARDSAGFSAACVAAANWLEGAGLFREAVDMALRADDPARAAELLDRHSEDFYAAGLEEAILPYAALLPAELRDRYPRLLLAMSWRLQVEWRLDRSREMLTSARARIDEIARDGDMPPDDLRFFQNQLLHRDIMQAQFEDDFAFIDRQADKLTRDFANASPYVKGSLFGAMLYAQREQFELGQQNRLEALAREQLGMADSRYVLIFLEALSAPGRLMRGQTDRLVETLTENVQAAEAMAGPGSALGAVVALPLAEIHFERHELEPTKRLLDLYLPNATTCGFVDQLIAGWITEVRMLRLVGDIKGALLRLDDAISFAAARSLHRLRIFATAEAIDINCRLGNIDEAARLAAAIGLNKLASSAFPENKGTRAEGGRALAWTKLAQLRGQYPDALAVAKRWRGIVAAAGSVRDRVRWDLRIAALHAARGDERPARRLIQQALVAAAPGRMIHRFLDEARTIAPLMPPPEPAGAAEDDFQARFAADVLAAVREVAGDLVTAAAPEPLQAAAPVDGLSAREVKILKLVGAGLLNGEIGEQLGITEGSVKWYLQRIYDKVGSRRRLVAVEQARRMGLLG
jgi:LuxR family maltose regulon positive regulatory protein